MGFGPPARNRKKVAPEIGPEIGPAWTIGKKWGKNRIFRVLSYFFPIFSVGPISGPISGAIFFAVSGRRPETHFLPGPRVLNDRERERERDSNSQDIISELSLETCQLIIERRRT